VEEDQREIETQLKRREWVRWCVWEEVRWGFRQSAFCSCFSLPRTSRLHSLHKITARLAGCGLKKDNNADFLVAPSASSASLLSTALRDFTSSEAAYARRLTEQWTTLGEALGPVE
jgi:hypothetical protein